MFIDMSHPIWPGMQTFDAEWHNKVSFEQTGNLIVHGRRASKVVIGTHSGTHLDAPSHFVPNGLTVDKFPLELVEGLVSVLDFRDCPKSHRIDIAELKAVIGGRALETRVLMLSGWGREYGQDYFYKSSPHLSLEAAHYLANSGIQLICHDMPSLDDPVDNRTTKQDSPIHKILLSRGIWLLEYVNSKDFPEGIQETDLWVFPLPLKGLDGSPARCIARV